MNTPVLCNKPDIDLEQYPELAHPLIAFAALVMACDFLAQTVGGDPALWLDRFSNAVQLMTPEPQTSSTLEHRLAGMVITLIAAWKKLQVQALSDLDEPLYLYCQTQLDDLSALLQEWEVRKLE
jgi:hypothetical protein